MHVIWLINQLEQLIYWGQSITQQRFLLSQAQVIYEWLNTFTTVEVSFGGKACCNEVTRCNEVRLVVSKGKAWGVIGWKLEKYFAK